MHLAMHFGLLGLIGPRAGTTIIGGGELVEPGHQKLVVGANGYTYKMKMRHLLTIGDLPGQVGFKE